MKWLIPAAEQCTLYVCIGLTTSTEETGSADMSDPPRNAVWHEDEDKIVLVGRSKSQEGYEGCESRSISLHIDLKHLLTITDVVMSASKTIAVHTFDAK